MNIANIHRLIASVALLALGACSGGGGSAVSPQTPPNNTSTPVPPAPVTPTNTLVAPLSASASDAAPTLAASTTPSFLDSPNGTSFAFTQSVIKITPNSATPANIGATTLTVLAPNPQGMQFRFSVPALGVETTHLPPRGVDDGFANGGVMLFDMTNLDYTLFGRWNYTPDARINNQNYQGFAITGYQTAPSGIPASGSAAYFGAGTAQATIIQQSNPQGALGVRFTGDTTLNANFGNGTLRGALSNMVVGGQSWHNLDLNGTISGANISGSASIVAGPTPSIDFAFSANSTGTFNGAFYGPSGQEIGAVWTLADPNGTKAAYGVFAAKKQ
jgi:hypothetical protein